MRFDSISGAAPTQRLGNSKLRGSLIIGLLTRFRPLLLIEHPLDPCVRGIHNEHHHCDDQEKAENNENYIKHIWPALILLLCVHYASR